jgi:hypothetical protein
MLRKALGTIIGGVLALALMGFVPQARADSRNQLTEFKFNQPVRLPHNVVLPAGSYWFRVPDVINSGNIVQVYNANRTQLLATIETIATERPENPANSPTIGDGQLTIAKLPNHQVPLIIKWIYPGQFQGHEFVYSPKRENQLAKSGHMMTIDIPNGGAASVG